MWDGEACGWMLLPVLKEEEWKSEKVGLKEEVRFCRDDIGKVTVDFVVFIVGMLGLCVWVRG